MGVNRMNNNDLYAISLPLTMVNKDPKQHELALEISKQIEGDDLSEIQGEQYQHRLCNGWLQVDFDARFVREL